MHDFSLPYFVELASDADEAPEAPGELEAGGRDTGDGSSRDTSHRPARDVNVSAYDSGTSYPAAVAVTDARTRRRVPSAGEDDSGTAAAARTSTTVTCVYGAGTIAVTGAPGAV